MRHPSLRRWFWLITLTLLPAIILEITPAGAWRSLHETIETTESPSLFTGLWLVAIVVYLAVFIPRQTTWNQIRGWYRYPPLWLALPLSACLTITREHWISNSIQHQQPNSYIPDIATNTLYIVGIATTIIALYQVLRPERNTTIRTFHQVPTNAVDWEHLKLWISETNHTLNRNQYDFFSHSIVAQKVSQYIQRGQACVALSGDSGSGKTTIIDALRTDLEVSAGRFVTVIFDMQSTDLAKSIHPSVLVRIESALSHHGDTSMVRLARLVHWPDLLPRTVSWLPKLIKLLGLEGLIMPSRQISLVLGGLDLHLVLVLENLDERACASEIAAFNRFFRNIQATTKCSLVLTGRPEHLSDSLARLTAVREYVPSIQPNELAHVLSTSYYNWISMYADIDPHPSRDTDDKFEMGDIRRFGIDNYLLVNEKAPIWALRAVIRTPRTLKQLLRHVDDVWEMLHGEAELDDIIIFTVLRYCAVDCFKFITENIESIRHENADEERGSLMEGWQELINAHPNGPAIGRLTGLSGLPLLGDECNTATGVSPQGVHIDTPTDYFSRIITEDLRHAEVTDQLVLHHIEKAEGGDRNDLVHSLNESLVRGDRYHLIWVHFSSRHDDNGLLELGKCVVLDLLRSRGSSACACHPVLSKIWNRRVQFLGDQELVALSFDIIRHAAPVSLSFINGFLDRFVLDSVWLPMHQKATIFREASMELSSVLQSPEDLIRILSADYPGSVLAFVDLQCRDVCVSTLEECADIFVQLIVDACEVEPDLVLPQIARIALSFCNQPNQGEVISVYIGERQRLFRFFRHRVIPVLQSLSDAICEDKYVQEARPYARIWLDDLSVSCSD